jgi:hypothetical protein
LDPHFFCVSFISFAYTHVMLDRDKLRWGSSLGLRCGQIHHRIQDCLQTGSKHDSYAPRNHRARVPYAHFQ